MILVSMNLRKSDKDIERLTTEYRVDSEEQNKILQDLENRLSEIENGSEAMKTLDPEFEKQLTGLTTLFDEYKKKELIEEIIQWVVIGGLTAYVIRDIWKPWFQ